MIQRGHLASLYPIAPVSQFFDVMVHPRTNPQIGVYPGFGKIHAVPPVSGHPISQQRSSDRVVRQVCPSFIKIGGTVNSERVEVRKVCRFNLELEIKLILKLIKSGYKFASMDTEFPGIVVPPKIDRHVLSHAAPCDIYEMMKDNVDKTHIIQLGLALSHFSGKLPVVNGSYCCWEFNFCDFDLDCADHLRNNDSIELLKRQGIDFADNRKTGILSTEFAWVIQTSGLAEWLPHLTWATFQSSYDFGFLVKIFTGKKLPEDVKDFMALVKTFFGFKLFDIKFMMKFCDGLFGGLDRVATKLGVCRVAGNSHQAGSDSLLTLHTFLELKKSEKRKNLRTYIRLREECKGVIYGLGYVYTPEF